jgi:hypothetical protein
LKAQVKAQAERQASIKAKALAAEKEAAEKKVSKMHQQFSIFSSLI